MSLSTICKIQHEIVFGYLFSSEYDVMSYANIVGVERTVEYIQLLTFRMNRGDNTSKRELALT